AGDAVAPRAGLHARGVDDHARGPRLRLVHVVGQPRAPSLDDDEQPFLVADWREAVLFPDVRGEPEPTLQIDARARRAVDDDSDLADPEDVVPEIPRALRARRQVVARDELDDVPRRVAEVDGVGVPRLEVHRDVARVALGDELDAALVQPLPRLADLVLADVERDVVERALAGRRGGEAEERLPHFDRGVLGSARPVARRALTFHDGHPQRVAVPRGE